MDKFILSPIALEELANAVAKKVSENLLPHMIPKDHKKREEVVFLTRKEVSKLIGVSLVTLSLWTKQGLLPSIRIQTRVRYKESDVLEKLDELRTSRYKRM